MQEEVNVKRKKRIDNLAGYAFISPFIIGFLCFTVIPMGASLFLSFTSYDLFTAPKWVGLDNYKAMLTDDEKYWGSLKVTFYYVLAGVPLRLAFALFIAVILNRAEKGVGIYRTLFYLPSIIGGSVAVAIMWRNVFGNDGVINALLFFLGFDKKILWYQDPTSALWTLILLSVWQFGSSMLIFLAGLKNIPPMYQEAASVDGANRFQRFFLITLPLLSPIIFFNLVMQTISAFMTFTPAYIISKGEGGPLDGTLLYSLYLFQRAFNFFQMGYASAMAWVMLILIGLVTFILFKTSSLWVHYESKEG
ncbi:carbohydrate ABC transporter permease [Bacillus sp. GM2]|jgi:multiple sugar transport system permease protein|uniref:carbohydrate ABC transporter permease n=1 Tax=Bacillus TaxID=1386 RepID=UPI0005A2BE93|nr:sugar ABC transporter permease [Bacillus paralicheniformis]ARA85275.1 ABC transporter permease [Bacillus paralicheniformis]AYQ15937.1 sugar ABC transporter permease [Bacillus paralicheniformis]KRT89420.1 ABC transporter permease [Bacillus paralicheniformis]MCM3423115.1 sugar ABC transporter permease [Bacillus paralicheniformis]MCR3890914.1 sugar ABC transporter permease [Bacillus paralicheniformis]